MVTSCRWRTTRVPRRAPGSRPAETSKEDSSHVEYTARRAASAQARTSAAGGRGMRAGDVCRCCTCSSRLVAPRPPRRRADPGRPAAQHERLRPGRHHRRRHRASAGVRNQRRPRRPAPPRSPTATTTRMCSTTTGRRIFGVTSPVFLDELTPWGQHVATIPVPTRDFVTSFSSKSELALNLSTRMVTTSRSWAMTPGPAALDVSNANTPGVIDPPPGGHPGPVGSGNGDLGPYYRVVAQLDRWGHFTFTLTNAYSGNNGRAAITNDEHGQDLLYTAGNAGNGVTPCRTSCLDGRAVVTPRPSPRPPDAGRADPGRELQHHPAAGQQGCRTSSARTPTSAA